MPIMEPCILQTVLILTFLTHSVYSFGPQPRIISQDGNLIFNCGENKNIRFITKGEGKIFLNDGDLTNAASIARNASDTLHRINTEYYDTFFEIQKFKKVIEGRQGIISRLQALELGIGFLNSTNGTSQPRNSFPAINRRIRLLQRKVNRLVRLLNKNECATSPCKNGGVCEDLFNGFLCQCPDEWEGATCERDVNECAKFAGTDLGCQNGAECINKPGSYECKCNNGWKGIHCTKSSGSCMTSSASELCGHGTCIPQNNGADYKCICDQGWTTDGVTVACLTDVDECKSNTPYCSKNPLVSCINTPGSFRCGNCPEGYAGNGHYCTDIDECALFNGGCSVSPMVRCINTPGSRMCGPCPPGYLGDGTSCSYRGVCGINNGGCHHFAQCRDNPSISSTYVECICPAGYIGSGIGLNGCTRTSEVGNLCASNPCVHGTCITDNVTGSYICQCTRRFTGRNCDIRKDPCQPNPCRNGGTCQPIYLISFRCVCTASYTGNSCQTERQACGGLIKGMTGAIKYPETHSHVSNSKVNCAWVIQTNITKVLNITFTKFNLQESTSCRYDWLQIHDGRNTIAQTIGRFCGKLFPNGGNILTTHHQVYLWLRIDSSITDPTFELNWESIDPLCGEDVTVTSHGVIRSPGYPGNYPLNRDCYWTLSAQLGKRIQFHFFSLMIGNSINCTGDYLAFYQGYATSDTVLAKYCTTTHPEPLYSAGPIVLIHFHSDSSQTYPGFQISYSSVESLPGCGGIFTAVTGELGSPLENGHYPPDLICEYRIQVVQKSRIKITFLNFDLEDDSGCNYDYVALYDGSNAKAPLINKYCGSKLPPTFTSTRNSLFIVFSSDWGNADVDQAGFRIKYETVCGGIYMEPSGVIESPGYPEKYMEDQICIYEIVQPLSTTISLTFIKFRIETSQVGCLFDFLEIRDGDNENSTLIGQYCNEAPPDVQSTHNYLWLKFESDSSVGELGFQANYTTADIGCGGILKSFTGTVKSPEHPMEYPTGANCTWVIVAPPNYAIQLSWLLFKLEESTICGFDYVEVYNNHTVNEMIGRYCGTNLPPTIVSTSNIITIKFVSDGSINLDGFMVSYVFVDQESACGGKYFTSTGVVKTPFYPDEYPSNRNCEWFITVNPSQQILLNVTFFELEEYQGCAYDYLEIRNGGTAHSPLIGRYCGTNIPKQIPSHANQMYLRFNSDMSTSFKGFKIEWESTATGCGGTLTSPRGSIISPNYPEIYSENADCFWKISVSAGSLINLVFANIDIEKHDNCAMDYVEVFDGPSTHSKSLGKFCNAVNIPMIRSTSNTLSVLFRSDGSIQERGFLIQYNLDCQNTLKGFRGVIESPNFPYNYPYAVDCTWNVEVAVGNKINITFSHFELEPITKDCSINFVNIKYSADNSDMVDFNTFCGTITPRVVTINSNIAKIHYVTNSSLLGSGFRLEWQIEGCGGIISKPSGSLSTPNYPHGYPTGTHCDWLIQLEYGFSIEITFEDIDLETSSDCGFDYVLVINGPDDTYPQLTKFCTKSTKPITISSSGNSMFVRFVSDYNFLGKGFVANYSSVESKCGGKMIAPMGSFYSPNYPKNYDNSDVCEWLIEIDQNHVIELMFSDLDLASGDDCATDYIKIYDGPSAAYPVLSKICGNSKPEVIKSSKNYMVVELQTGHGYTAKGFSANYTTACGANIVTANSGIIQINDSTLTSLSKENCSWTIINADPSQHVTLVISHLSSMDCSNDEMPLRIYNGASNQSPLLAEYCEDKLPPPLVSEGDALHIEVLNLDIKFVASYHMVDTKCGGTLTAQSGFFATPRYPNNYPMDMECEWTIQVAPGNKISLVINSLDLVTSQNCHIDYLEIRQESSIGKLIGTYCESTPISIHEIGSLWILFKSGHIEDDNSATGKGFMGEYSLDHGIDLSGPTGRIASPLYPYYASKEDISWTITVTFGRAILLSFIDFYLEMYLENECVLNYMEIYDGYNNEAPLLDTLCGTRLPKPIKSTSNVMYIKLIVDTNRHGSRFLCEWWEVDIPTKEPTNTNNTVEGCGYNGVISIAQKTFYKLTSPGYPFGYDVNLNCEWIFSTSPGYHLAVRFTTINLEVYSECLMDTVKIYNKNMDDDSWNLIATVCRSNHSQQPAIHGGSLIKVVFETDSYGNQTGFEARIRNVCGSSLIGPNGVISVNSTEFSYFVSCEWNVTVQSGKTIQVEFLELDVQRGNPLSCESYVLLKNGHYPDSPILGIGKYCNNDLPELLNTTGNHLYVKYLGYPGQSFKLTYKEMSNNCGGTIVLSQFYNHTIVSSPNYPNIPPPYSECQWTIMGPPGQSLRIDFVERFDITVSSDCTKAAVEVRDGGSRYSPLLGQFCGEMPNSTFSSDNMIHVRFFTTLKDPRNGFKAQVSIASCGGIIRSEIGTVRSPSFNVKSKYPVNADCIWHLIGPPNHHLILQFTTLDLEHAENEDCLSADHVTIEQNFKFNDTINTIGVYCGNTKPGEIHSSSNEAIVHLVTGNFEKALSGFQLQFNSSQEVCGGRFNTESGEIQSAGYPSSNEELECDWTLTVPEGRRILLEFDDLDLDVGGYGQGLSFYNDEEYNSLIKVVKNNTASSIRSSGNVMHVLFWSSKMSASRGFKAHYSSNEPSVCVGDFKSSKGVLRTINETKYYCVWKHVTLGVSETLAVSINVMLNSVGGESRNCKYPNAAVFVTSENENNVLAIVCKSTQQSVMVRSPYSVTKLMAYQKNEKLQYTINYATHPCGGIINNQDGFITSPAYPQKSAANVECSWIVKIPVNQQINLNFVDINFDTNCEYNYIIIYNGETPSSPKIGHFCHNNKPTTISTQSNVLLIEYHADERSTGNGFKLRYQPNIGGCGGIFHDHNRIIESPAYPKNYPHNAECVWEISCDVGYSIKLDFIDRFFLEESKDCTNDFLEVWNYSDEQWMSMGKKCGRETPKSLNSTSNKLKIVFRSNDKASASGFKARWTFICGGVFEASKKERYIVSPGYPNDYNNSLECVYNITSPSKEYINLDFDDFSLEQAHDCKYDNVTIIGDSSTYSTDSKPPIYCGTNKPPPLRTNEDIIITFKTDPWVSKRGFKFSYKLDDCGGIITEPRVISSPISYDTTTASFTYTSLLDCYWNITAPPDKVVILRFTKFDLEHNLYCSFDYVEAFDGLTTNSSARLAQLCGNLTQQLPIIKSTRNSMIVHMKTDFVVHSSGFKAVVFFNYGPSVGCGGLVTIDGNKIIEAPLNLGSLDCHWDIITTKDHILKLTFTEINLEPCPSNQTIGTADCNCNVIEVRNGGPFSEVIERSCNNKIPTEVTTSGHTAWLRLYTLGNTKDRAFKAIFTKIPSLCGQSILNVTNQTQVLTSPGYPNSYPNNLKCRWKLVNEEFGVRFDLRFVDFDLVESSSSDFHSGRCTTDKIEITDKSNNHVITEGLGTDTVFSGSSSSQLIYRGYTMPVGVHEYCGKTALLFDHYSGENEVIVAFNSEFNIPHGRGFKIEYRIAGCNRNFTSIQGRLMNHHVKEECIITITVPENYTISLYFLTFISYDSDSCKTSSFEIRDGDSESAPSLGKLCGYVVPDPVFSTGNKLWINTRDDGTFSLQYDIVYTSSPNGKGCGGIFYNYAGKFSSPLYPQAYRQSSTCVWEVKVPQGMRVAFQFDTFDINGARVEITTYNKDGTESTIHKYTYNDEPAVITSENNRLTVTYITTVNSGGTGFLAQYLAVATDTVINW